VSHCRSQWPTCLRRGTAVTRLLRLSVHIPPGAWMFVSCDCCVLSGRGLCDELITRPEESYRLWYFVVCGLETSRMRRPWPALGRSATGKEQYVSLVISLKDWLTASRFGLRLLWKSKPNCSPDLTMQIEHCNFFSTKFLCTKSEIHAALLWPSNSGSLCSRIGC
jgi:hypothetical protein